MARDAETLANRGVGHRFTQDMVQAGMEVTGPDPFLAPHLLQGLVGKKRGSGCLARLLEQRRGKLEQLDLQHHLVDAAAAFLADVQPSHE